jgi:hypothetical protein
LPPPFPGGPLWSRFLSPQPRPGFADSVLGCDCSCGGGGCCCSAFGLSFLPFCLSCFCFLPF